MLVVHPASLCDVCLDPYSISSEPTNSPHAIACGHIFCLACLRNLSPSACPLCRKSFQPDRVKKLHVAGPPELDGAAEESIEEEATQLLQRVVLVSGEDVPDVEIIEVVTLVEEWLAVNSLEDDSHRPLRAALATLQRFKALQERNERDYAEFRRIRRELKAHRRSAHQDSKTSRAVEESLLDKINEIESEHALEVSQDEQSVARYAHVFQLSRLHAELNSLRGEGQGSYRNTSNPLPPPPAPLHFDRFPPFARLGGTADTSDRPPTAVPYPPPPPRVPPTSNGYTSYGGTTQAHYVPPAQISQPLAVPRARNAEVPRGDERSRRQEANGMNHAEEERRPHAESSRTAASRARYANTEGKPKIAAGPLLGPRAIPASSPAPSWAHHPFVEGGRSDEEREVHRRVRTNGANGVLSRGSNVDPRRSVDTRLASAEAYVQGYGSGYDSGFQIANESPTFTSSSYGSDRSDRPYAFPVQESPPDQPIGGLGLMGVPQPSAPGTVSTPDEDATPLSRPRGLIRRNTTQAVDMERSARRLDDQPLLDMPQNGGARRAPVQTLDRVLGVRRTMTEGSVRHGVNGTEDLARHHRTVNGAATPIGREDESPRSETTWGTVQTLSRGSVSGGSLGSLGWLVGLHHGGYRGQATVAGEPYAGREGRGDSGTSEEGEEDGTETPIATGSLPGSESDVSSLGLIREEEGDYTGSRHRHGVEDTTSHRRSTSYTERIPHGLDALHERQPPRAGRSDGTNGQRRHSSQSTIAEALHPDSRSVVNPSDITSTNALSLHFDASFPTHDYQDHGLSAPSGPEIIAPTPIVGGPNIIHLWANRV